VIFNAEYRSGRIFKINGKLYLPHSLYSIIFETPPHFEMLKKFLLFLSSNWDLKLESAKMQYRYEGKELKQRTCKVFQTTFYSQTFT